MSISTILLFAGMFLIASMAYAAVSGAPWVPTRKRDIEAFLDLVEMEPSDVLYELGCGDARLSVKAAQTYGVRAVGVELSALQASIAWLRAKWARVPVKIRWRNAFNVDLSDADVVYIFLMPETYEKIRGKLKNELNPGTKVISYVWEIPDWEEYLIDSKKVQDALFVYEIPRST